MHDISQGRFAAACGIAGAGLNLLAVGVLFTQPKVYKPGAVGEWLSSATAHPTATTVAAWAFTVGLAALVPFCVGLARRDAGVATGAALLGAGALINAAGTLAPVAALHVERPVGLALLWLTLLLDSAFNMLLALGLLMIAAGMQPGRWPRGLRGLAVVAGVASLPVSLQFAADPFAMLLAISGPLWVGWVIWASLAMARADKAPA